VTATTATGLPTAATSSYGYNSLNQLDANDSNTDAYDAADNPSEINGVTGYDYNDGNELTSSPTLGSTDPTTFTYNNQGERTGMTPPTAVASPTVYSYDQAGNLTGVSQAASASNAAIADVYTYDGNGLRQSATQGARTANPVTTQLSWDTSGYSGSVPTLLADGSTSIIYGPDQLPIEQIDDSGNSSDTGSGNVLYYHHDQQGSTIMLTDQSGNNVASFAYGPTGTLLDSTGSVKPVLGYDGQLTDWDTGLIYLRARVYDSATEQFLTRDPDDNQTRQAYEYAGDSPVNMSDPSGLDDAPQGEEGAAHYASYCQQNPNAGSCTVGDNAFNSVAHFVKNNRGTLAELGAVGVCLTGVGTMYCAGATVITFGIAQYQNWSDQCKSTGAKVADTLIDSTFLIPGMQDIGLALAGQEAGTGVKVVSAGTGIIGAVVASAASDSESGGCGC
jgi:RHS repeat-associated protein